MSRYIDADLIGYEPMCRARGNGMYEDCEIAYKDQIDDITTADVRENVRGEWVTPTEKMYSMDGEDITPAYKECNRCHKVYVRTNDNFCPNCGADMRGEQDGER